MIKNDAVRDEFLKRKGFRVVRLSNKQVFETKTVKALKKLLKIETKLK